jgi:type I restriction enzyme, S subunit
MNRETAQNVQSPAGWKSATLGTFGQFKGGSGFPIRYQGRTEGYYPFIKVSDFSHPQNKDGITTANHFIDKQTLKAIGAKVHISGSIVFAKIGAALFLERKRRLFVECCIDNNMMSYSVDEAIGDPQFFHVLFNSIRLSDAAAASALPVLSTSDLRDIEFCCPPLPEQQAIAKALGDVDGLIASLEALIAKKRDIKQGAMQELLSGHRRLPGFKGEWKNCRLINVVAMKSGMTITSGRISEGEAYRCFGGNGLRGHTNNYTHNGEYVLIGRQGALCGNVERVSGKFFASEHAIVVTCRAGTVPDFMYYYLTRMNLNRLSEASAQPGLSVNKLLELECKLPSNEEEQLSISSILIDMDAEIAALEAKLAKTRDVKQGMMQVLLTGEVRLI